MKKPELSNLRFNEQETKKLKSKLGPRKSIKVTINIDTEVLNAIKEISSKTGVPYQRLINKLLSEDIKEHSNEKDRLDKMELEIEAIKKKLSA